MHSDVVMGTYKEMFDEWMNAFVASSLKHLLCKHVTNARETFKTCEQDTLGDWHNNKFKLTYLYIV